MDNIDYQAMARETLRLGVAEQYAVPSPGVVYRLEKNAGTFVVKALASSDISRDMCEIRDIEEFASVHSFSTPYVEMAEVIVEQLSGKRFPIAEDSSYGLSDPGFDWWLDSGTGYLKLSFARPFVDREKYVNIGPIGDGAVAYSLLSRAVELLEVSLPLGEVVVDSKHLYLSSRDTHGPILLSLQRGLLEGIWDQDIEDFDSDLNLYFSELAAIRRFWLRLEENFR